MKIRTRKFIGTFLSLFWVIIYALVMMVIGAKYFIGQGQVVPLLFYIFAGFAWLPVEMIIIKWMSRPDAA